VLTNVAEYGTNPLGTGPPVGPAGADADVVAGGSAPFADVAVGAVAAGAEDAPDDAPETPEGGGADAGGAEHAETSTQHRPTATKPNLATPPRTTPPPSFDQAASGRPLSTITRRTTMRRAAARDEPPATIPPSGTAGPEKCTIMPVIVHTPPECKPTTGKTCHGPQETYSALLLGHRPSIVNTRRMHDCQHHRDSITRVAGPPWPL